MDTTLRKRKALALSALVAATLVPVIDLGDVE
jgi:hypothetical protein